MINGDEERKGLLSWLADDDGLRFQIRDTRDSSIPFTEWGATKVQIGDLPGSPAPLLTLVEDGDLEPQDESLLVPYSFAASWDRSQVRQLGLPPVVPFRLNIQGRGVLSSPGFRFRFQLQNSSGVPVMGANRTGILLRVGNKTYSLLDPLFSIIESMERFNSTPEEGVDARFAAWDRIKSLLPEDAVVDQHLKSMNIVRADAVTLDPLGDDQFYPVLLGHPHTTVDEKERGEPDTPTELLPPVPQRSFAERFSKLRGAQRRYALVGNWFVMVPETLHKVLGVIREEQDRSPERRRAFLADPHAHIKERLAESVDPESIDDLFRETPAFLSGRIRCLGEWSPKLHAFVSDSSTDWLPPDEKGRDLKKGSGGGKTGVPSTVGVPTNEGVVRVVANDIPEIVERLRAGRNQGDSTVDWQGQSIPTDEETEEAFTRVHNARQETDKLHPHGPIIEDNIESLGFVAERRTVVGQGGGLPAVLASKLYPHQQAGLEWLQSHWSAGSRGALLADDMGLGKTVQTLAFLSWVGEQLPDNASKKPHLIVAPTGLLKNWEAEAEIHLSDPGMGRLLRAYGKDLKDLALRTGIERRSYLRDQIDWVLTTYETLRDKIKLFVDVAWRVVVFDEAQKIKNPAARVTDMAKSLDAELTLALTGTPVENSLSDLWCIADAVQPGVLGAHNEFRNAYAKPAEEDPTALTPLRAKLERDINPALLLRRMKQDHLNGLPEKWLRIDDRPMSSVQSAAYDEVVASARARRGERGAVLEALHELRRVSLLPNEPGAEGITDELVNESARLTALVEALDKISQTGEKALVFVEFLKIQEALIPYLRQRYGLSHDPIRIHGGTPGHRRKRHVDQFQSAGEGQFDVMLLSPKAAGVGLTLTAANHVIHLSRWWNPAVEDQCTDRVYRIGQRRDVHVHVPVAVHPQHGKRSFDFNLHRLLERKRQLSLSVLAPPVATSDDLIRLVEESL